MRQNRFPVIDGDGHVTERSERRLEYLGGNYRGTSKDESWADTRSPFPSLDGWSRLSGMSSPGLRDYPECATWISFYPYEGQRAEYPEDIPGIEARADISESAKRKILADNARRFYRLKD